MRHTNRHASAASHELAEAAADFSEDVGSVAHAVGGGAVAAAKKVRGKAGRAVKALEKTGEYDARDNSNLLRHGLDNVRHWEKEMAGSVGSRPIASLLIAAGIGVVVGMLCVRRRR